MSDTNCRNLATLAGRKTLSSYPDRALENRLEPSDVLIRWIFFTSCERRDHPSL